MGIEFVSCWKENVYIATDDNRIKDVVENNNYNCIITKDALTGTDRLAEAKQINKRNN